MAALGDCRAASQAVAISVLASLAALGGCGGDGAPCGPGATLRDGACVPGDPACDSGTVLVDGQCQDPAHVVPDVAEPEEPNGMGPDHVPGTFTLPAVGDSVVLGGCIEPVSDATGGADYDRYLFEVAGPALVDITVAGYGGLDGAFLLRSEDDATLEQHGWMRVGASLVNDTSRRQAFLPAGGVYGLVIADSRTLLIDGAPAAGDGTTCYLATVARADLPEPTPITGGARVEDTLGAEVELYSYDPAEGDLAFITAEAPGDSVLVDVVVLRNGAYHSSSPATRDRGRSATAFAGDLHDGDRLTLVVDAVLDYGTTPGSYRLDLFSPRPAPLPGDGSAITVPSFGRDDQDTPIGSWAYFDAAAGDVMHIAFASAADAGTTAGIFTADLELVTLLCAPACPSYDGHVQLLDRGRYYLYLFDDTRPQPQSFELTAERQHVQPMRLAPPAQITGAALGRGGSGFYELDPAALEWWALGGAATGFGGDLEIQLYERDARGTLGREVPALDTFSPRPGEPVGRILDASPPLLLRVRDTAHEPGGAASYDLSLSDRPYTDLGTVDLDTPVDRSAVALDPGQTHYYLVHSAPGWTLEVEAAGADPFDAVITRYDPKETAITTDDQGAGAPESVEAFIAPSGWLAFSVREAGAGSGTYDLRITAVPPPNYEVTAGAEPFASVCPEDGGAGQEHPMVSDGSPWGARDDGVSETPLDLTGLTNAGLQFYGMPVTELTVSSNGWLTFEPGYAGSSHPEHQRLPSPLTPDAVLAPLWTDLHNMTICTEVTADRVVVQWSGTRVGSEAPVQMQIILDPADHSIDVIYGPDHAADSGAATIGVENLTGTVAALVSHDTAGNAAANTSWHLAYAP